MQASTSVYVDDEYSCRWKTFKTLVGDDGKKPVD